jgi:hypothetical protein
MTESHSDRCVSDCIREPSARLCVARIRETGKSRLARHRGSESGATFQSQRKVASARHLEWDVVP